MQRLPDYDTLHCMYNYKADEDGSDDDGSDEDGSDDDGSDDEDSGDDGDDGDDDEEITKRLKSCIDTNA